MLLEDRSRTNSLTPGNLLRAALPMTIASLLLVAVSLSPACAGGHLSVPTVSTPCFAIQNFNDDDVLIAQSSSSAADEIADQVIAVWTSMAQPDDANKATLSNSTDDDDQSSDDDDDSDS